MRALGMPGFTDAGVSSAPLHVERTEIPEGIGDHRLHAAYLYI